MTERAGPERIADAAARLREGGLVAFPTETVYGLGADALNPAAVQSVFLVKGRPSTNPLIVHVTGIDMAARIIAGNTIPDRAARLMRAFWPGPLSIILPKHDTVPGIVTGGSPNVALRAPDHPIALALLFEFGGPLVGPSANPSGGVSPTTAEHVRASFTDEQVMTLDGGPCGTGIESTVVSLVGDRAVILRPGVVGPRAIGTVLHEEVYVAAVTHAGHAPMPSPGMLASHYAPRARAVLLDDLHDLDDLAAGTRGSIALLSHSLLAHDAANDRVRLFDMPPEADRYAAALYDTLRRADATNPSLLVIHTPPTGTDGDDESVEAIWSAVHDRLRRATTH